MSHFAIHSNNVIIGPLSELPPASNPFAGVTDPATALYLTTDSEEMYVSTGTSWQRVGNTYAFTRVTANYTALTTDQIILVNAASKTITLPDATTVPNRYYIVKNDASGSSTTVKAVAGTIDGTDAATGITAGITTAYNVLRFFSDGVNWYTV